MANNSTVNVDCFVSSLHYKMAQQAPWGKTSDFWLKAIIRWPFWPFISSLPKKHTHYLSNYCTRYSEAHQFRILWPRVKRNTHIIFLITVPDTLKPLNSEFSDPELKWISNYIYSNPIRKDFIPKPSTDRVPSWGPQTQTQKHCVEFSQWFYSDFSSFAWTDLSQQETSLILCRISSDT